MVNEQKDDIGSILAGFTHQSLHIGAPFVDGVLFGHFDLKQLKVGDESGQLGDT